MRNLKLFFVTLILLLSTTTSYTYALDWASSFVVWKGNVYSVDKQVVLSQDKVGEQIGKVKRLANDRTGSYYGDAANLLQKGTPYFEIKEVPVTVAIAVKVEERYLFAEYSRPAPFHIMNVLLSQYFWLAIIIGWVIIYRLHKRSMAKRSTVT